MGNLRGIGFGVAALLVAGLAPAPATARADDPSSPDPSVMDVVDLVLAASPQPTVPAPPTTQPPAPNGG
jgi:hypothetical protein